MPRLIVDGMSIMKNLAGQAAVLDRGFAYSFLTQVTAAVKKLQPQGVDVCWEGGHQKRAALLPDYKSKRTDSSPQFKEDREAIKQLLTVLGAHQHVVPGYEADDTIASIANEHGGIIMSGDKDMLQLVSKTTSVYQKVRTTGRKSERVLITPHNFQDCTGWYSPHMYLHAHCALGDSVDQIPKLAGVGEGVVHAYFMGMRLPASKKALLDEFYADSPQYLLNKKLIDLTQVRDLPLQTTTGQWNETAAYRLLEELGFASIAAKFDTWIVPWEQACKNANVPTVP